MVNSENKKFILQSEFAPAGDQINAIKELTEGCKTKRDQVLLGVTGSGKTFTMANVIQNIQKPTLIMAHNKTLAAQLYEEMKSFFPDNAVEYFVSYYDYYQPEAYIAKTDQFIEKDSSINEQIDLMRHSATRALVERDDVIIIASVSCIYGLGSPELYAGSVMKIKSNTDYPRDSLINRLVELQYKRNDVKKERGTFAVKGDTIEIFPAHLDGTSWKLSMFGDFIEEISECESLTGQKLNDLEQCVIYANTHFMTSKSAIEAMVRDIKAELIERIKYFNEQSRYLEAQRIEQRTNFDMEMILETGSCKGIENYSRFLTGRKRGEAPPTLFEYLPQDSLLIVDESHVTLPQIRGMINGDRARKNNLVNHGFRLLSAMDNRPLSFEEWDIIRPKTIYVSATPGSIELEKTNGIYVQQIIRPTGLIDPECIIKPVTNQVDDLINECQIRAQKDQRVLCTTLTKKKAEDLCNYLKDVGVKAVYLHSDIKTLERIEIIQELRYGTYDVLIGVNLLREGLDIPECSLVAILDADKEGFLRSETSLIQTIGRAARNENGTVILYADKITKSIKSALDITEERRKIQIEYNLKHNITPKSVSKKLPKNIMEACQNLENKRKSKTEEYLTEKEIKKKIKELEKDMIKQANNLEFEKAAKLKEERNRLKKRLLLQ